MTKHERLFKWQIGEISDKIEIRKGDFGHGIYATEKIEKGKTMLRIEPEHLITADRLFKVLFSKKVRTNFGAMFKFSLAIGWENGN